MLQNVCVIMCKQLVLEVTLLFWSPRRSLFTRVLGHIFSHRTPCLGYV